MTISRAETRKLLPYLRELPHEAAGMFGITHEAFSLAGIPSCRIIGAPFLRPSQNPGSPYAVVGGEQRWCQIVDKTEMQRFAGVEVGVGR